MFYSSAFEPYLIGAELVSLFTSKRNGQRSIVCVVWKDNFSIISFCRNIVRRPEPNLNPLFSSASAFHIPRVELKFKHINHIFCWRRYTMLIPNRQLTTTSSDEYGVHSAIAHDGRPQWIIFSTDCGHRYNVSAVCIVAIGATEFRLGAELFRTPILFISLLNHKFSMWSD